MERIDELITRVLNCARKKVEDNKRNIPFSKEKHWRRAKLLHWKVKIRSMKGKVIDQEINNKRKEIVQVEHKQDIS